MLDIKRKHSTKDTKNKILCSLVVFFSKNPQYSYYINSLVILNLKNILLNIQGPIKNQKSSKTFTIILRKWTDVTFSRNHFKREIYYLEPFCPLVWWLNPPKTRFLSKQKKGHLGARYVVVWTLLLLGNDSQFDANAHIFFLLGWSFNHKLSYTLQGTSPYLGGGFNYFYFHPYFWKIPILTNIFQMDWNHQPDILPLEKEHHRLKSAGFFWGNLEVQNRWPKPILKGRFLFRVQMIKPICSHRLATYFSSTAMFFFGGVHVYNHQLAWFGYLHLFGCVSIPFLWLNVWICIRKHQHSTMTMDR